MRNIILNEQNARLIEDINRSSLYKGDRRLIDILKFLGEDIESEMFVVQTIEAGHHIKVPKALNFKSMTDFSLYFTLKKDFKTLVNNLQKVENTEFIGEVLYQCIKGQYCHRIFITKHGHFIRETKKAWSEEVGLSIYLTVYGMLNCINDSDTLITLVKGYFDIKLIETQLLDI